VKVRRYVIIAPDGLVRWQISLSDPNLYPSAVLANMQPGDVAAEAHVRTDIDPAEVPGATALPDHARAGQVGGTRDHAVRHWHNRTHHSRAQRRDTPQRGPEIVGVYAFAGDPDTDLPTRRSMVPIPDELLAQAPRLLFWRDGDVIRRRTGNTWSINPEELTP